MRIDNTINPTILTQATAFLQFSRIVDSQGGGLFLMRTISESCSRRPPERRWVAIGRMGGVNSRQQA
ncbi:MAG TPA: hypothetical protein ENH60_00795 [Pricia sp.]|nr:hypothetical protein [Pricia sp.]